MKNHDLRQEYGDRHQRVLAPAALALEVLLKDQLSDLPRVDRISCRAKSIDRFVAKASKREGGVAKYADPLNQIQDQIGARIVVFYLDDISLAQNAVERYHRHIEKRAVEPEIDEAFGYRGFHYVVPLPRDVLPDGVESDVAPDVFELQIKTLWQHAWSEANHDLGYKPDAPLTSDQRRRLAFTAAQAWGADQMFHELSLDARGSGNQLSPRNYSP